MSRATQRLVLVAMADLAEQEPIFKRSVRTLMERTHLAHGTVVAVLTALAEQGVIVAAARSGGRWSTTWRLVTDRQPSNSRTVQPSNPRTVDHAATVQPPDGNRPTSGRQPSNLRTRIPPFPAKSSRPTERGADNVESARPTKARKRAPSRTTLPDGFALDDDLTAYATNRGVVDPDLEFERFRNHHAAKGSAFADWRAAWRTWVGRAIEYRANGNRSGKAPKGRIDVLADTYARLKEAGR
jgi:hypothetical protein